MKLCSKSIKFEARKGVLMTIPVEKMNDEDKADDEPSDGVFVTSMKTITLKDDRGFFMKDGKPWSPQKKENGDSPPDEHSDSSNHNEPDS